MKEEDEFMSTINNKPTIVDDEKTTLVRNAIEHRATWFYLLLDEARKRGLDMEEVGRAAIYRCGCFHGVERMLKNCEDPEDLRSFLKVFADETGQKVFEMEIVENSEDKLYIDFHYCPLVAAWQKLGVKEDEIPLLCDIAMDGDRGICSRMDGYEFKLGKVIAKDEGICEIRIERHSK